MKKEWNLSDNIFLNKEGSLTNVLNQDYVVKTLKEFIRRLKEALSNESEEKLDEWINRDSIIDKLAGEKLTR